jgi:pimeloyl-ACP methyl ester carboxylesterase
VKKLLVSFAVLAVLVFGFNLASNEYRVEFRDWAIAMESEKAGLLHRTVTVNGQEMALLDNGVDAPVMLMLHGFSGSKENWLRLAQQFGAQYRVIAPDLLADGENTRDLQGSYHIVDQVNYVHSLMEELKVPSFHLVGNSMGGAISSLYAARHPEQVLSVTLISPAGVHDIPSKMDELLEQGDNPLIPKTEEDFYQLLDFVMSEKPFIPAAIARAEAEIAVSRKEINQKIFADIRSDLTLGLDKEFGNIRAPMLIIWGDQDNAINVENIDRYAELVANSEKAVIEGIGHVAMIEVPAYTAELMRNFLNK